MFPRNRDMIMDTPSEIAELHSIINMLPKLMLVNGDDIEDWIESALSLM